MRTFLRAAVLVVLVVVPMLVAHAQLNGAGRSFVLTVPYITEPSLYQVPAPRLIVTSGSRAANVTLTYTATGATESLVIPPNSFAERRLDTLATMLPDSEGVFNSTLQVTASEPVLATVVFDRAFVSESYQALPDSMLGLEYFAVSNDGSTAGAFIAIQGIYDETEVVVTPSAPTIGGRERGKPFTIYLDRGEVYQIESDRLQSNADLTGTHIVATKPVGVLSGAPCVAYSIGFPIQGRFNCNPLLEQIPPTDSWGTTFFLAPLYKQSSSVYRIVAQYDSTRISFNSNTFTINAGAFHEIIGGEIYNLLTDKPVMVVQMATSTAVEEKSHDSAYGEPAMVTLAPVRQWGSLSTFTVPQVAARADLPFRAVDWEFYGQITIDRKLENTVMLDDTLPDWLSRRYLNTNFFGIMRLKPGRHKVTAADTFTTIVYGYSSADAMANPSAAIRHLYPLGSGDIVHGVCGSEYDTTITVTNWTDEPVRIDSIEFAGQLSGLLLSPASLPITVPAHSSIAVTIRFRGLLFGKYNGSVVFWTIDKAAGTRRRVLSAVAGIYSDYLIVTPAGGTLVDLGGIPSTIPYVDTVITLFNKGARTITVSAAVTPPAQILPPATFPMDIPPNETRTVTVRYTPDPDGAALVGRVQFYTKNCPDPTVLDIRGSRRNGGYLGSSGPSQVRLLCPPKLPDTLLVTIDNLGDLPITISSGTIVGTDAAEFSLLSPLASTVVAPGSSLPILIRYTPGGLGARDATLRVVSDAINIDTLLVPLDVRNDTIVVEAALSAIDLGATDACDPVPAVEFMLYNTGTVDAHGLVQSVGDPQNLIVSPAATVRLVAGDSLLVRVEATPTASGALDDTLRITIADCDDTLKIPITGMRESPEVRFDRDTIAFAPIGWCGFQSLDSVVLINSGAASTRLRTDKLPSLDLFRLRSPATVPTDIAAHSSVVLKYTFRPDSVGRYVDSLALVLPSCGYPRMVVLVGVYDTTRPELSAGEIDFGSILVGASTTGSIVVRNRSLLAYTFSAPELLNGPKEVQIVDPTGDVTLQPGDSIEVTVRYSPVDSARALEESMRLVLREPCADTMVVRLIGRSLIEDTGIRLRWEDTTALVGSSVSVRLIAMRDNEANAGSAVRVTTGLGTDPSMFLPLGVRSLASGVTATMQNSAVVGNLRVATVQLEGAFPDSAAVAEVDGLVLLGGNLSTPLLFVDARAERVGSGTAVPVLDSTAGTLTVSGICTEGPARLVRSTGALKLSVRPNMVSGVGTLEYELVEDGETKLTVTDATGAFVATMVDGPMRSGAYEQTIDASTLPDGVYWIVLRTRTQVLYDRFVVVR